MISSGLNHIAARFCCDFYMLLMSVIDESCIFHKCISNELSWGLNIFFIFNRYMLAVPIFKRRIRTFISKRYWAFWAGLMIFDWSNNGFIVFMNLKWTLPAHKCRPNNHLIAIYSCNLIAYTPKLGRWSKFLREAPLYVLW